MVLLCWQSFSINSDIDNASNSNSFKYSQYLQQKAALTNWHNIKSYHVYLTCPPTVETSEVMYLPCSSTKNWLIISEKFLNDIVRK